MCLMDGMDRMEGREGGGGKEAYRWSAARLVAVSSTRMSVLCPSPQGRVGVSVQFDMITLRTEHQIRIRTRFDAKYPGSATSSAEPVTPRQHSCLCLLPP